MQDPKGEKGALEGAEEKFLVSTSPHIRSDESIPKVMWTVVGALVPVAIAGCYFFGWKAAGIILGSVAVAVATEAAILAFRRKPLSQALDGSAVVTGLLFAMVISSNVPWYVVVVGAFFAIAAAKHLFGGLGFNIWNPALAGRAFVLAAWSLAMTAGWATPLSVDAVSKATPLNALKMPVEGIEYSVGDLFFGNVPGSLGETSALLLLIGGIFLIARKYVDWRVPVSFVVTAVVLCMVIPYKQKEPFLGLQAADAAGGAKVAGVLDNTAAARAGVQENDIIIELDGVKIKDRGGLRKEVGKLLYGQKAKLKVRRAGGEVELEIVSAGGQVEWYAGYSFFEELAFWLFSGGLILGAFFMATDMVTSPMTRKGGIIFGVGCGVLTAVIRKLGGYPEGVCYSILIMNTAVPLIDRFTVPKKFGLVQSQKA
jgi:electron transport complex protein RnfD